MDQFKVELSNISSDQQSQQTNVRSWNIVNSDWKAVSNSKLGHLQGGNDGSPISIHRKNSYRLAQEQKLFLESNSNAGNKTNRNVMSRKVKPINNINQPNGINSIFNNGSVGDSNNHGVASNGDDQQFNNHHHLMTNSTTNAHSNGQLLNGHMNNGHGHSKNSVGDLEKLKIHEPVRINHALSQQQPPYVMVSNSAKPSPTHFVVHKAELRSSPDVIESHDKVFANNLYDSKVLREVSSSNGAIHVSNELKYRSTSSNEMASMDANYADSDTTNSQESQHSYPPTTKFVMNTNVILSENKSDDGQFCDGTDYKRYSSTNYSDKNAAILFNNLDHSSNVNFMRRNNQRKNTSDSNVKLLADHNFYHVTNKLQPPLPSHENSLNREDSLSTSSENYEEYEKTRIHQSHSHPQSLKGITAKTYHDMPEYYTYNNTYRNTSSNSLVALREKSGREEELTANMKYTKSDKMGPSFTNQIIGEKYHNENDINSCYYDSSTNGGSNNGYKRVSAADYTNGSDKRRNDMTHLTSTPPTNTSLNLSIHTAEEFGMEMLEWLNNENKLSNHHIANGNPIANNATLV